MDSMIEDYNEGFVSDERKEVAYTVDNVVSDAMLRPYYAVSYLTTLCLTAPSGGAGYKWTVEVGENANDMEEGKEYTISTDRTLTVYLKESTSLLRWGTYKLTLTVQKMNSEYLKDMALLYVY